MNDVPSDSCNPFDVVTFPEFMHHLARHNDEVGLIDSPEVEILSRALGAFLLEGVEVFTVGGDGSVIWAEKRRGDWGEDLLAVGGDVRSRREE